MFCNISINLASRRNPDSNPPEVVDDLEKFLEKTKNKFEKFIPIRLERSPSLPMDGVLSLEDLYFDLKFENSLFRSKSETDLDSTVVDDNFLQIPENSEAEEESLFTEEERTIFWDTLTTDLNQKLCDIENRKEGLKQFFLILKVLNTQIHISSCTENTKLISLQLMTKEVIDYIQ